VGGAPPHAVARDLYHRAVFGSGRELPWQMTPVEAVRRWPADQRVLLLHSGRPHPRWSRWSVLAAAEGAYRFDAAGRSGWVGGPPPGALPALRHRPFADLRSVLAACPDALWIGHLSYELGRWIERLPAHAADDRRWPVIQMHRCAGFAVHDALTGRWSAHGDWAGSPPPAPDAAACTGFHAGEPAAAVTRDQHEAAVRQAIGHIAAGDVFQVNLAQRFTAPFSGSPRGLFAALADASPAWYGAYLELSPGPDDPARRAIASTSPELFLDVGPDGQVVTRPIKGTRPAADADDADRLLASAKDTAELHMIVDLLRNDLGRVCDFGSVRVAEPRTIESHPTVHHGVATVTGRLHRSKDLVDLLRATMPGGSITGAPKVRAMQIIDALEPVRRGPYCGAIGCVYRNAAVWNIAIRTMLVEQPADGSGAGPGRVDFSVGGGIVADSDPAAEYDETLDKAAALLAALASGGDRHQ